MTNTTYRMPTNAMSQKIGKICCCFIFLSKNTSVLNPRIFLDFNYEQMVIPRNGQTT
jgi:hypothetical protein